MSLPLYFFVEHRKRILLVVGTVFLFLVIIFSLQFWKWFHASPTLSNDFLRDIPKKDPNGYFIIEGMGNKGQVQTKDFITGTSAINPQGDRILSQKSDYDISYINPFRQFFIAFNSVPTDVVRKNAESELLSILGVSESDI